MHALYIVYLYLPDKCTLNSIFNHKYLINHKQLWQLN